MLVDIEYWNIQLLIDDISVSSSGSQISVIQQREKIEQLAGSEQDKDDRPDSTTDHSRKRDEENQEVIIIFFTINGAIQFVPKFSTNSPMASVVPTAFIVLVGIGKELYLEIKRYREDNAVNSKKCEVLQDVDSSGDTMFGVREIQHIKVGDILRLKDDDYVPADCVLV